MFFQTSTCYSSPWWPPLCDEAFLQAQNGLAYFENLSFPRGLYYKTFYSCYCCCIVIRQSICNHHSLPLQSNIFGHGQEPTIGVEYCNCLHSGRLQPSLQILDQGGIEWQWQTPQLNTETFTAVKSLIVQTSGLLILTQTADVSQAVHDPIVRYRL